jgi:hypothetical protein
MDMVQESWEISNHSASFSAPFQWGLVLRRGMVNPTEVGLAPRGIHLLSYHT